MSERSVLINPHPLSLRARSQPQVPAQSVPETPPLIPMKIATLATLMLCLGLSGCQMIAREYHYRVVLVNLSKEQIPESQVLESTDTYRYGGGILSPSGYSAHAGPMETAPNDVFIVRWKDAQGQTHERNVDLRNRVKRSFKGEIVFVYSRDQTFTVEVVDPPERYPIPPQRPKCRGARSPSPANANHPTHRAPPIYYHP